MIIPLPKGKNDLLRSFFFFLGQWKYHFFPQKDVEMPIWLWWWKWINQPGTKNVTNKKSTILIGMEHFHFFFSGKCRNIHLFPTRFFIYLVWRFSTITNKMQVFAWKNQIPWIKGYFDHSNNRNGISTTFCVKKLYFHCPGEFF